MNVQARWRDHNAQRKQSAVLFDLVSRENARSRSITRHVDDQDTQKAIQFASESVSPFDQLNELLALGTLSVSLENSNDEEILAPPVPSTRRCAVWVSNRMQTCVYHWRPPTCRREPDAIEVGTIRTTSAPLSSIPLMTVDHHRQGAEPSSPPRNPPSRTRSARRPQLLLALADCGPESPTLPTRNRMLPCVTRYIRRRSEPTDVRRGLLPPSKTHLYTLLRLSRRYSSRLVPILFAPPSRLTTV